MRIVAISDIHGRTALSTNIINVLGHADLVIIAGDITNFGGYEEARRIVSTIQSFAPKIVSIPGNCDRLTVNKYLEDAAISVHGRSQLLNSLMLYGVGGCATTPFHTPQEYTDDDIATMLNAWQKDDAVRWHILITHCPPFNTRLDRTFLGQHVGSKTIRAFIEKNRPDLVICGHIHEARGVDRVDSTICINPGTFPKHYASITINTSLEYELF
jgi:Icc-related predicted phosphoesterase